MRVSEQRANHAHDNEHEKGWSGREVADQELYREALGDCQSIAHVHRPTEESGLLLEMIAAVGAPSLLGDFENDSRPTFAAQYAAIPVTAWPRISPWISCVPS